MSDKTPVFNSPLTIPGEVDGSAKLGLSDMTGIQVTQTLGEIGDVLGQHFSEIPEKPGDVAVLENGFLTRLTRREFFLLGKEADAELPSAQELETSFHTAETFGHTADYTHGMATLKLKGADAAQLLSKICGLDFHDDIFGNQLVKQTSAAKIKTMILRCDEDNIPTYILQVSRPFGQYLTDIVWDAGQEFNISAA